MTLVSFYIQTFRFFKVTSSPSLDWDQSCQAGEQAKLNSVGGVFLGSSSILHTSVLLGHSFPSTFKPSDSSRVTSSPSLDLDQSCQAGEQAKFNSIGGVFLGSSRIVHTSVLLRHSSPSTFIPSES